MINKTIIVNVETDLEIYTVFFLYTPNRLNSKFEINNGENEGKYEVVSSHDVIIDKNKIVRYLYVSP